MNRSLFASVLAASMLYLNAPVGAAVPPPLPHPSSSFSAGTLHVDVYGTPRKPALVFIPGLTCGPWEWSGEIARFAADYTIYALTLPGFDGVAPARSRDDAFQMVSADFWNMLQTRDIVKPIVVGHSLGGTFAIMLAEQHSDRLRAAVAVDGMPVFPGMERSTPDEREAFADRMSAMIASVSTPAQFETAEKTYSLPYMVSSKSDIDAIAPLAAHSDPKATAQWMRSDLLIDLRPQLSRIGVPLLEIAPFDAQLDAAGPAKFPTPAAKQAYYASLLSGAPTARVVVIEPSRHFIMYDQPQRLHAALTAFLQAL